MYKYLTNRFEIGILFSCLERELVRDALKAMLDKVNIETQFKIQDLDFIKYKPGFDFCLFFYSTKSRGRQRCFSKRIKIWNDRARYKRIKTRPIDEVNMSFIKFYSVIFNSVFFTYMAVDSQVLFVSTEFKIKLLHFFYCRAGVNASLVPMEFPRFEDAVR